jgi:hypothetical protein
MKKEDQETPKGTKGPITSKNTALTKLTNREATKHSKNGKNDSQINTPDPPTPEGSITQHSLMASSASWHTRNTGLHAPPIYMTFLLHSEMPGKPEPLYRQDPGLPLLPS